MDPEVINRADRIMAGQNNIQNSIQNMKASTSGNAKSKTELSAAAILFDENNDRGFKTTAHKHVSPDQRQSRP